MSKKSSKSGRSPAWMNKELLAKLKCKREACKRKKLGEVEEEHRGTV